MTPQNLTQPQPSPFRAPGFEVSLVGQLAIIREMLGTLDTLTMAGQRDIMAKVVSFIRDNGRPLVHRIGCSDEGVVVELLGRLAVESERLAPDPHRFGQQAHDLVDLLSSASPAAAWYPSYALAAVPPASSAGASRATSAPAARSGWHVD